ncbi:Acs Acyl-coenzyme A synthetases/AMP-(fatty) acid ligases [Fimbriimonadaceae bacterium]
MESEPATWIHWPVTLEGQSFASAEELLAGLAEVGRDWPERARQEVEKLVRELDPKLLVRTSGSTGDPKEMEFSIAQAILSARATAAALGLKAGDRALLALDAEPIGGRMMIVRALGLGLDLSVCAPASIPTRPRAGENFDFCALVPRQLHALEANDPDRLASFGTLVIGGGPVDPDLEARLAGHPQPIYHTFAMTETLSHFALRQLNWSQSYTALPSVETNVDEESRLIVTCPWANESPLLTQDLVEVTGANQFIWHGRADLVINTGGVKVHPEQVEAWLAREFPNRSFAVTSEKDASWGERLVLLVEGGATLDLSNLIAPNPAWVPKRQVLVAEIPKTRTGKPARAELKALLSRMKEGPSTIH